MSAARSTMKSMIGWRSNWSHCRHRFSRNPNDPFMSSCRRNKLSSSIRKGTTHRTTPSGTETDASSTNRTRRFRYVSAADTRNSDRGNGRESARQVRRTRWCLSVPERMRKRGRLTRLLTVIWASGLVVLVGTLAAGWFLTGRALPRSRVSVNLRHVSRPRTCRPGSMPAMETELGQLATTINATFDRLERAFDQQTQFTADASHELRTPLSIVFAQTELTLRKERTVGDYKQTLDTVRSLGSTNEVGCRRAAGSGTQRCTRVCSHQGNR